MLGLDDVTVRDHCQKVASLLSPVGAPGAPFADVRLIVFCAVPGTASATLSGLLRTGAIANSRRHFRAAAMKDLIAARGLKTYDQYVRAVVETATRRGIFAVECDWLQFAPLYAFGAYDAYFRSARYIYVTRGDLLEEVLARNTPKAEAGERRADFDNIRREMLALVRAQNSWERFFGSEGIAPLRLRSEEIEAEPAEVVRRVAEYAGTRAPAELKLETPSVHQTAPAAEQRRTIYIKRALQRRRRFTEQLVGSGPI